MKFTNFFTRETLARRIALIYFFCVFLPIVATSIFFANQIDETMRSQEKNNLLISLERARLGIENSFNTCMIAGNFAATDKRIQEFISTKYTSQLDFYNSYTQYVSTVLPRYVSLCEPVNSIYIYSGNRTLTNAGYFRGIDEQTKEEDWYQEFSKMNRTQLIVTGIGNPGYRSDVKDIFINILSREIGFPSHLISQEVIIRLDMNISHLYRILDAEKNSFTFYLVNNNDEIIVSTAKQYEPLEISQFIKFSDAHIDKVDSTYFETPINQSTLLNGWKLVGVADSTALSARLAYMKKNVILVAAFCMVVSAILTVLLSNSYTKRIGILTRSLDSVRFQRFERIDLKQTNGDMGKLIETYNLMSERIDRLVNDVHNLELQKKDFEIEQVRAELNLLQSQLNPHFLFNTLNAILVVSMKNRYNDILPIIQNLARLMRRLLNWSNEQVSVHEELNFVEMYLEIEQFRFKDKFSYHIDAEETALPALIPKMTLQPLVENACKHGIQQSVFGGKVEVYVCIRNERLYLTVKDNGAGITEQRINEIYAALEQPAKANQCVGVRNVYRRLALCYHGDFTLSIMPNEMAGTVVEISIPLSFEKVTDEDDINLQIANRSDSNKQNMKNNFPLKGK